MTTHTTTTPEGPELAGRPRELDYEHLTSGDLGYWPVLCAVPDDVEPGNRVHFPGDDLGDVVAEVHRTAETCPSWPCRIGYTTADGRHLAIGRMARGFRLDRWGRHATLSTRGAR